MKKSLGPGTIAFPTPTWVIGTYDGNGIPDVSVSAWAGICCSKPPCVTVSFRSATYTHGNITNRKAFTVNIPSRRYIKETDYFGVTTGRSTDKFADVGLTPVKSEAVDAPYIAEFPLVLECRVIHVAELGLHTQFIGEIIDVKADEVALGENGAPDIQKVKPFVYSPTTRAYYGINEFLGNAFSIGNDLKTPK
ncbi:MAG TPA: flavin reductase family protein [Candidatus Aquicultor sp.]|jgi:flavin reductase (DIM6/NTAB) family NADH-FMN oxidoreductase RutF